MSARGGPCNLVLVGHNDSGKTTLAEAMLYAAKAVPHRGSVADGTSILDAEPEEKERKTSIDLGMAHFAWGGREINLLDAPGMYDFCGEAYAGLLAAENALVCVHAASGIMVNTRRMWKAAGEMERVRAIVVTKLDLENIDLVGLLGAIRETFGPACVPLSLPVGLGASLGGVVGIFSPEVPKELSEEAQRAREKLVELDDALLEKYLAGEAVAEQEVRGVLPPAVLAGRIVPLLFVSAVRDLGVRELLEFVAGALPAPQELWKARAQTDGWPETAGDPQGPFIGQIFKSVYDPFVGRVGYGKVVRGVAASDRPLVNMRTEAVGRVGTLFRPFGKEARAVAQVEAGGIFGVTKVDDLRVGDTVTNPGTAARLPEPRFPVPMVSLSVEPKSREHEQRLTTALGRMADGEKTFQVDRDTQTGELVVTGISQFHIEVMLERMRRRYQVEVVTKTPKIAYKETVTRPAEGHHRHKKQTGGRGQYAECYIRLEPLERGAGFEFDNEIKGGKIPIQFIPGVEKGIREAAQKGVLAGYPVVDFRVRVYDGSFHEVDSSLEAFKIAGSRAFKKAFGEARPALLEPVVNLEVTVPASFLGDVTGHLNQRRGRILGIESEGTQQTVQAQVPLSEVMNYAAELRSMTGGEGSYSLEFSHYEILPQRLAEAMIARAQRQEEDEEER